jgi:hypothetical protein
MKDFKQWLENRCWKGYEPVPGKKPYAKKSCKKIKENFIQFLESKKTEFSILKDNKVLLKDEERERAIAKKAVWHMSNSTKPTCAIWKSKKPNGSIVYVTNTHRCYQTSPTLDGAIKKFHDVVKDTA